MTGRVPGWVLTTLSGALLALSFPGSGDQAWIAFVALVPLLAAIDGEDWRRAGVLGFVAGLVFWLGTIPWLAPTLVRYGDVPWPLAGLTLAALVTYLALYMAAFCALLGGGGKQSLLRRGALLSLVAGAAAAVAAWRGWGRAGAGGPGYHVVARWRRPDGEGWFVAVSGASHDELRSLGTTLREEFARADTAVVMVFDDPEAAREARRGSRVTGEVRFQAAIRHQRAMYEKHAGREHRFVIYERYPLPLEIIDYAEAEAQTPERPS